MIAKLKPYPEYKDSGLPWLNQIPNTWDIRRAKNVFNAIDIRSMTGKEELLTVSANYGVVPRKTTTVTMFKAESYVGYKLCWPGDLVINSLWAWMQGLGFSKYHGVVSSAYGVYRLKKEYLEDYRYFDYLLRAHAYLWELRVRSKGIWRSRYQLKDDAFFEMPILLPPEEERRQIVVFLMSMLKKLDDLIKAYKRLVGVSKSVAERKNSLLYEYRTRLISDVVTGKVDVRDIPVDPVKEIEEFEDEIEEMAESEEPVDADE
jgi:type I restriction enzyme S subunit